MFSAAFFRPAVAAGVFFACLAAAAAPLDTVAVLSSPPAEVESRLPESHPSMYLLYAGRLWYEARRDDAVFWLYVGQIRFRFYLAAQPGLVAKGDAARFDRLMETTGEPIRRYAGADIPKWRAQIARALIWDKDTPNGFTSTTRFARQWGETRATLVNLITYLLKNAADVKAQRELDGIGETGMRTPDGPYVEVQQRKMPRDWAELLPHTTLPMLAGFYDAGEDGGLGPMLFSDDPQRVAAATSFEIVPEIDDRHLRAAAWKEHQVIGETRLKVDEASGAIVFTNVSRDTDPGLINSQRTTRYLLRRNEVGDLVTQRETLTTGTYRGKKFAVRLESTTWNRAERLAPEDEPTGRH